MLSGEFEHTLDEKNRLTLPARFRAHFAEGVVLTRGLDKCLNIYTEDAFSRVIEARLEKLDPLSRKGRIMHRFYYARAVNTAPDKQGRVMLPQVLLQSAEIGREVMVVGVFDHLEVWDRATWHEYMKQIEEIVEDAAERLTTEHD